MTAEVSIDHGVPSWLSSSIVPSKDQPQSILTAPTLADVNATSTDVYVYVKVENTGTQDLGVCTCTSMGLWNDVVRFSGAENSANVSTKSSPNGQQSIRLDATNGDVLLIGGNSYPLSGGAIPNPHHRAWGWSADGRFLGYVRTLTMSSTMDSEWKLSIFALQTFTDSEGTVFSPGDAIVSKSSGAVWTWTNFFFRWAGSNAVLALGPNDPDHPLQPPSNADILEWYALCPSAPATTKVWHMFAPHKFTPLGTLSSWSYVFSPCESFVAFLGHMAAQGQANIVLLSAEQGTTAQFTINNVPTTIATNGPSPSISTTTHTAQGVTVKQGDGQLMSTIQVDDPECTALPDTLQVVVDRVKASTLPTANLGVMSVGQASAGPLMVGQSKWVQVPNQNMNHWGNQGEEHWCLLAQAFTADGTTIARPWDGQAVSPPPFPNADKNCAQRNIMISP
jgi:hypothetical protein